MIRLIGRRLVQIIPTLIILSVIIFLLQRLLPGDPANPGNLPPLPGDAPKPAPDKTDGTPTPAPAAGDTTPPTDTPATDKPSKTKKRK